MDEPTAVPTATKPEEPLYDAAVWKGGGAKGLAYASCTKIAHEAGLLTRDPNICGGTSIGSLFALFSYLQLPFDAIRRLAIERELMNDLIAQGGSWLWSPVRLVGAGHGCLDSVTLENYAAAIIAEHVARKSGKPATGRETFADLHSLYQERQLVIAATNVTRMKECILSFSTTPLLPVAKAVSMSMAFPGAMTTVVWDGDEYCDGGVMDNFVIAEVERRNKGPALGFYLLVSPLESDASNQTPVDPDYRVPVAGLLDYAERLLDLTMIARDNQDLLHDTAFWSHVAAIVLPPGISTLSRNLSLAQREDAERRGVEAVESLAAGLDHRMAGIHNILRARAYKACPRPLA